MRVGHPLQTRLIGVSDTVLLLCGSVWGRAQKGTMAAAWPLEFCLEESCPLALALMSYTSIFSPYATGSLLAAALVLEPSRSESE